MFEVVNVVPDVRRGLLRRKYKVVVMVAKKAMSCQYLSRTFQGHGHYSTQTYQVDIAEGDRFSLAMRSTALRVGDQRSLETVVGEGYLREYGRMVATTG
jgi:hypothetical protein